MEPRINDFSFRVATVNGTGSQSRQQHPLQVSFSGWESGVCGKNLFPLQYSRPADLVSDPGEPPAGYQNLREFDDIAVCLNAETAIDDITRDAAGLHHLLQLQHHQGERGSEKAESQVYYPIPIEDLAKPLDSKLRHLLKNLFYVGAITELYGIDLEVLKSVIKDTFKDKQSAIDANMKSADHRHRIREDAAQKAGRLPVQAG